MAVQESRLVISIDARNAERTAKALNSELQGITDNGAKADSQINAMGGSLKALAGYMGGIITLGSAISMADGYTQMAARIRNATSSAEEYELVQERILATANTTFRSLGEAQEVYLSMAGGMKSLGYQTTQTLDLVDSLSFSFTHNATRADQAQSAMDSLSKSMAKGKIDADAWISIVTGADNVIADMAMTTGKTEAEIRKLGAEGKASLEDLIKTLIATRDENERLANNMENSLADGFTKLSNELTVYLGKANEATSATGLMAAGLTTVADNLDLIANTALVAGIGYVTKAILTKTVAVQGAIAASVAQKAADAAEAQSSIAVATAKVNEAKAHLANVQATNAETQAKYGAAAANARYKLASDAVTQALVAQTAAQGALNTSVSLGSRALALVGGPIGAITLGVGALAAGYMYLQNRTAEANAKLEEQGKVANKTKEELLALRGVQLDVAKDDLAASFEAQNEALRKADIAFNGFIRTISLGNKQSTEAREIYEQVRQGLVSQEDAIQRLNKLNLLTPEQKAQGLDLINTYEEARRKAQDNAEAQKVLGVEVKLAGNASQNAAGQHRDQAAALNGVEGAARGAANALSEYTTKAIEAGRRAEIQNKIMAKGYSESTARDLAEIAAKNGKVTQQEAAAILYKNKQEEALRANIQARAKVQSDAAKASKKAESEATKQRNKEAREAKRQAKEAARDAKETQELVKEYSTDDDKRKIELEEQIKKLREHGLTQYIEIAKNRFNEESKLIKMKFEYDLVEFELSEEKKLRFTANIREQEIKADAKLTQEQRKLKLDSLKLEFNYELAQIELAKEKRLFAANEVFMSEKDKISERYRLEREEILKNKQLTEQERQTQIAGTFGREALDTATQQQTVAQNYLGAIGVDYSMEAEFQKRREAIIAANEWEFITEQEKNTRLLELEKEFQQAKLNVALSSTEQIFGSLASMFDKNDKDQRKYYRAMILLEKSAAIARSTIAIQSALALAAANPFPMNLVHMATVATQTASIVGNIKSVADGFYTGGYTGNIGTREVAGVVHGQEYVLNAQATKRVGRGTLDALNNGGTLGSGEITVNIQNYGTSKAFEVQQLDANTVRIIARDEARNTVASDLQNPNSQISKAASQNLNAPRRRG